MIPCIEYTRASTSKQEYSVGDQDKQIREWAKRNKYLIVKSYCDDGISGHYASKRPGFLSMIEDITSEKLDVKALLIWDSYRFARNMVEFLTYKQMIQQHGISVIAVSEPMVQDEDAQLYINAINGASGELYLRKLSKDSKRGIRARVVDRHEHHGKAPFGYRDDPVKKELVIDDEQARWVHYIFDEVENGSSYLQICHHLNDEGVKTAAGYQWAVPPLKYVLRNKTYCGKLEVNLGGEHGIYEGRHPAIIDTSQFDRVQAIMNDKEARRHKYTSSTNKYVHWLSGLMYCPVCGAAMSHISRHDGRKPRYRCNHIGKGQACTNGSVKVEVLEQAVFEELERIISDPLYVAEVVTVHTAPVVDYDQEIAKLQKKLDRCKQAYIDEIDSIEEYRENKTRLTAEIKKAKAQQKKRPAVRASKKRFRQQAKEVLKVLQSEAPVEEKVKVSHALIEKICPDSRTHTIKIYFYG